MPISLMNILNHLNGGLASCLRLLLIQSLCMRVSTQHLRDLLQGQALGLREEEINEGKITHQNTTPDNIVLPRNSAQNKMPGLAARGICTWLKVESRTCSTGTGYKRRGDTAPQAL